MNRRSADGKEVSTRRRGSAKVREFRSRTGTRPVITCGHSPPSPQFAQSPHLCYIIRPPFLHPVAPFAGRISRRLDSHGRWKGTPYTSRAPLVIALPAFWPISPLALPLLYLCVCLCVWPGFTDSRNFYLNSADDDISHGDKYGTTYRVYVFQRFDSSFGSCNLGYSVRLFLHDCIKYMW